MENTKENDAEYNRRLAAMMNNRKPDKSWLITRIFVRIIRFFIG